MRRLVLSLCLVACLLALGCHPGAVGEVVRSEPPTASEALREPRRGDSCRSIAEARPLIVDWSSQQRLDLELAMKRGVAVVRYDCDGLVLLSSCALPGDYRFVGVSRKEDVVQLTSADELAANLPLSALELSAEVSRDRSLDLALVMVGMKSAATRDGSEVSLTGRCEGATHFVRAATIGAFAMQRGSAGKVRAVAEMFGAGAGGGSRSAERQGSRDGELSACRSAHSDAPAPPDQCQAALRLDLQPLAKRSAGSPEATGTAAGPQPSATGPAPVTGACPEGMVRSESPSGVGKCTERAAATHYVCERHDARECRAQCDAGSAGSCHNLAQLYVLGWGVDKDEAEARALYRRACEAGELMSCPAYALYAERCTSFQGEGCGDEHSEALLTRGCDGGNATACGMLAHRVWDQTPRRTALVKRACNLGQAFGCLTWADWLMKGSEGQPNDVPQALAILERACDGGSITSCARLSSIYEEGSDGVEKDLAKAMDLEARMCPRGAIGACKRAADAYRSAPTGVSRDLERAVKLYREACHMRETDRVAGESCLELSRLLRHWGLTSGKPMTREHADESMAAAADACHKAGLDCPLAAYRARERAFAEDKRRCAARDADACVRLEVHLYESGCELEDDADSCAALEARDPARLKAVRHRQCIESRKPDSAGCRALVELGGRLPDFAGAASAGAAK